MNLVINPGTGRIEDNGIEMALSNIRVFINDCDIKVELTDYKDYPNRDGRYSFTLTHSDTSEEFVIEMPALPIEKVRYLVLESQNIWDYPRLYVNGSSWVWQFAILTNKDLIEDV